MIAGVDRRDLWGIGGRKPARRLADVSVFSHVLNDP